MSVCIMWGKISAIFRCPLFKRNAKPISTNKNIKTTVSCAAKVSHANLSVERGAIVFRIRILESLSSSIAQPIKLRIMEKIVQLRKLKNTVTHRSAFVFFSFLVRIMLVFTANVWCSFSKLMEPSAFLSADANSKNFWICKSR